MILNELETARQMAAGEITGPQDMGGFALFVVRVTGTGLAYRSADIDASGKEVRSEEYAWRDPAFYLNPDFLARCAGLPVIWEHPAAKPKIDHEEFHARIVGTLFLPFIRDDEVWAVAKIYDRPAIELMREDRLSTSPGVVLHVRRGDKLELPSGLNLLNEPDPILLDHLAICEQGVWDKGGEPQGIEGATEEEPKHDVFAARLDDLGRYVAERDALHVILSLARSAARRAELINI